MQPQRVGFYGGAFDPPHAAHIALAHAAVQQLQLNRLHIVPTGHAWHKSRALTPAPQRLDMLRLAFADVANACIDTQEIDRDGPSYTLDSLRHLQSLYPQAQLFLIMGQDQADALPSWKNWQALPEIATICIAARAHSVPASSPFDLEKTHKIKTLRIKLPDMPISSTQIRQNASQASLLAPLVPPAVARYIHEHRLYQTAH
jgi:nicotinate-nucleotide adenylyltransferase